MTTTLAILPIFDQYATRDDSGTYAAVIFLFVVAITAACVVVISLAIREAAVTVSALEPDTVERLNEATSVGASLYELQNIKEDHYANSRSRRVGIVQTISLGCVVTVAAIMAFLIVVGPALARSNAANSASEKARTASVVAWASKEYGVTAGAEGLSEPDERWGKDRDFAPANVIAQGQVVSVVLVFVGKQPALILDGAGVHELARVKR